MINVKGNKVIGGITSDIFTCKLDDEEMNNKLIEQIDLQGDRQNHKTNVKATMTEWNMISKPGFDVFSNKLLEIVNEVTKTKYKLSLDHKITSIWGLKYKSEQETTEHSHWPAMWSTTYYINPPTNASSLYFPEFDYSIKPENGLLVIFEGWIKHSVPKQSFDGDRYVVSANIDHK